MAQPLGEAGQRLVVSMAELTNTRKDDWFLVAKARQGMQAALEAAGKQSRRSEVVTQLFTCVTAIDPIIVAGLKPCYVDIDPNTLSVDASRVEASSNTCAVVLQHTFGIVDQDSSVALRDAARSAGALLVEDSAHCVGRIARDATDAPVADVSVHSFGVEKILPGTYFGGAVWINPDGSNPAITAQLREAFSTLPAPDARLDRASRSYRNQVRVLTRLPHGASQALRARWERKGSFEPAVSVEERSGGTNHAPSLPSEWICEQALAALDGLDKNEATRRACSAAYVNAAMEGAFGDMHVPSAALAALGQPLLRFPVFAEGQEQAQGIARAVGELGYYVPDWPRPLLVPGVLDPAPYGLAQGTGAWPVSQRLSDGVVALPTDIDPAHVSDVVQTLRESRFVKEG